MENIEKLKNDTVSGVIWRFGERILAQFVNFVVSIILARILFPEEYGIVAIVTIFITIANAFVSNGLGTSLIQKKDADELDFSTIFHSSFIISIVLYLIIFLIAPYISNIYSNSNLTLILRIMGLRIPIAAINSTQQAYVSRNMIYKKFFFSTLIGTVVSGIVGVALAFSGFGVWALVMQYLLNVIIDTFVLFVTVDWRPKLQFSYKRFKKLFSYGWKVMAAGVIGTIFEQLKSFIIGIKYTSTDLAYYNRGEQIPALFYNNINFSFETVLFSAISKIQDDKLGVRNALSKMIKITSYVIIPIMFGLVATSTSVVKLFLTDKWLPCVPFLQIICFQYCFSIINNVNLQALKAIGRSDILLKLEFIKKPLFLVFILISMQFSTMAIVIASFLYGIVALIINAFPNRMFLNYSLKDQLKDTIPAFSLSLVMLLSCYLIQFLNLPIVFTLILQIVIGITVYFTLSILLKLEAFCFIINYIKEISFIRTVVRRILKYIRKKRSKIFSSRIFKVKKNKIVFDNFLGKGYGCNPKYIAEEIIKQGLDYDLVWLVEDMNQEMPKEIRKVKFGSIKSFYELATAKVWIDNVRNYKGVNKKNNQYYIQTWHGTVGLKSVEGGAIDTLSEEYIEEAKYDGSITNLFLTNNEAQVEYIKKYFWYNGEISCYGSPRCDILYKKPVEIKDKVYECFNIQKKEKIVLYAPTFRKTGNFDVYKFDYEKCCKILEKKFDQNYIMLIRLHPNISFLSNQIKYNKKIKNATNYPDIQELLAISDVVISDYSSVSFEAGIVNKPAFIFAKDLDEYENGDRKLLYKLDEIPFDTATTEEKLYENIMNFSKPKFDAKCKKFYQKIGLVNNDNSSENIVGIIKKVIGK